MKWRVGFLGILLTLILLISACSDQGSGLNERPLMTPTPISGPPPSGQPYLYQSFRPILTKSNLPDNAVIQQGEEEWIAWKCKDCGHRMDCLINHPPGTCPCCGKSDWEIIDKFTVSNKDTDGDWVADEVEEKLGTNPLNLDTDGDGMDDFNEIYVYPHILDLLNPSDAQDFLGNIPEIKAEGYTPFTGGTDAEILISDENGHCIGFCNKYLDVPKRDPLVQWYAENTYWGRMDLMDTKVR
jgi:hypothetical protein